MVIVKHKTLFIPFYVYNDPFCYLLYVQLVSIYHAIIRTYTIVAYSMVYTWHFPLIIPPLLTWRPPAVTRMVLLGPRLLVNCPLCPPLLPIAPCIPSSGLPRNPNVLLIRTHPNPTPSVANSLFITGNQHQKTTWLWIKETSRKDNGREE